MTDLINTDPSQVNPVQVNPISPPQLPPLPPQPEPQTPPPPQPDPDFKEQFTTDGKFDTDKLKQFLQTYLVDKCPIALPEGLKQFIVKAYPIIAIIELVLYIPAFIAAIAIGSLTFLLGGFSIFTHFVGIFRFIIFFIFVLKATPGLFKRSVKAWNTLYHLYLIYLLLSLISLDTVGVLIGVVIPLYVHFQIRSKYIN